MATLDEIALFLVVVFIIEGVWLIGLTYLVWRQYHLRKKKKAEEQSMGEAEQSP